MDKDSIANQSAISLIIRTAAIWTDADAEWKRNEELLYEIPDFDCQRSRISDHAGSLPDLKVIEIANAVGYENQGKFARVFAKKYGVAPLEYRRIKRGNL